MKRTKKKAYIITFVHNKYGFTTGIERRKLFNTKEQALHLLMILLVKQIITAENALFLFNEFNQLSIPLSLDVQPENIPVLQNQWDLSAKEFTAFLEKKQLCEETGEPTFMPCTSCGRHGHFFGKDFVIHDDVYTQSEGVHIIESLFKNKKINRVGRRKLHRELSVSKVPETNYSAHSFFFVEIGNFTIIRGVYFI